MELSINDVFTNLDGENYWNQTALDVVVTAFNARNNRTRIEAQDLAYELALRIFQQRLTRAKPHDYLVIDPMGVFQQDFCNCRHKLLPVFDLHFLQRAGTGTDASLPMLPVHAETFEADIVTVFRLLPIIPDLIQETVLSDWVGERRPLWYQKQRLLRNVHRVLLRFSPDHFPVPSRTGPFASSPFALCSLDKDMLPTEHESETMLRHRVVLYESMGRHTDQVLASMLEALDANPTYCPFHCAEQPFLHASLEELRALHLGAWEHVKQDIHKSSTTN